MLAQEPSAELSKSFIQPQEKTEIGLHKTFNQVKYNKKKYSHVLTDISTLGIELSVTPSET